MMRVVAFASKADPGMLSRGSVQLNLEVITARSLPVQPPRAGSELHCAVEIPRKQLLQRERRR
jgi:hypothetical protein